MTYSKTSINIKNNIQTSTNNIHVDATLPDRPWTAYYVTADDFFDILRVAYEDTYGGNTGPWHPEDMYMNVSCVLEIVSNTLANMANLKAKKPIRGVKEA